MTNSPPSTEYPEGENETRSLTSSIPVVEYIDCTPTWERILPGMIGLIRQNQMTKELWGEFVNMARAADRWNQHCKEMKS